MLGNKYVAALIGILLVAVIAYNIKFFTSKSSPPETAKREKTEAVKPFEPIKYPGPDMNKNPERIAEKEDRSKWKRDPFDLQAATKKVTKKPASTKPEFGEDIRLMGILKRNGRSHALINGKVYRVNDKIGDVVIKEIHKHSIILSSGEKNKEISFEDYKEISFEDYTGLKEKTK